MRFGINHLFTARERRAQDVYGEALEQTVLAEQLGFSSVWLAEHHFTDYGIVPSLATFAAAIAAQTHAIRIGTAVLVLPFGHPVRMAEEMAMVDVLSGGRLDIGVGRGYQPLEFRGLGVDQNQSREIFDEYLEIMRLAWKDEPFSYDGKYYSVEDINVMPKPMQRPLPVKLAAVSAESFNLLGRKGESLMLSPNFSPIELIKSNLNNYRQAAAEAGHDVAQLPPPPMIQQVFLDDDHDVARKEPEPYSMWFYGRFASLLPGSQGEPLSEQYKAYQKIGASVSSVTYERILSEGVAFGDPKSVVERMRFLRDEVGTDEIVCWFNFGGLPHERVVQNMKMFADQVMPEF